MRAETFIARRLYFTSSAAKRSSRPAIRVALLGIAIGVAVMLLTLCVVVGFKQTITDKVACFGAHIQVTNFDNNSTFELQPIEVTDSLLGVLRGIDHVVTADPFLTKPGILKTDDQFEGIVLKATDNWQPFASALQEGSFPATNEQIMLSRTLCSKLRLGVGDKVYCYFVGDEVRVRRFAVAGIYSTGFDEADRVFVLTRPEVIRRLNGWDSLQVSGVEIRLDRLSRLDEVADRVWYATANRLDKDGNAFYSQTLEQLNPQIFGWLDLLDMNVLVILVLMMAVSGFAIITGLVILILDNIRLIGVVKALGADNRFVRRIFLTEAAMLIGKGMLWGNITGLGLAALQYLTHLIPLDAATYYVSAVPIAFPWAALMALNLGVAVLCLLVLLGPSAIAARVSPADVMRYE